MSGRDLATRAGELIPLVGRSLKVGDEAGDHPARLARQVPEAFMIRRGYVVLIAGDLELRTDLAA
jgi:hypothetical protein